VSVLVKICGLTRPEDVDAAVAAGADMVGFILVEDTPRHVELDAARALAARAPAGVRSVAVVAVPGTARVEGFDLTQSYDISARGRDVYVATRDGAVPADLPDGMPILLDMAFGGRPERSELEAHWARAAAVRAPVILAGSLDPANVADAVRAALPWAVDTARGVESAPGIKDHDLVRRFVRNAKEAA
jgi:phosphoribosylanthranilate isomerase